MEHPHFKANGKVLLTGEYAVLYGAMALAVPLSAGQTLQVATPGREGFLEWQAWYGDSQWFQASIRLADWEMETTSNAPRCRFLIRVLRAAIAMGASIPESAVCICQLDFAPDWGLGSSSTFIALIAKWLNVDAFRLHQQVSSGSGYDVVCALADKPLIFSRSGAEYHAGQTSLCPDVLAQLYLVRLHRPVSTEKQLVRAKAYESRLRKVVSQVTALTIQMANTTNPAELPQLFREHENLIAWATGLQPIRDALFADFAGGVKSLGAWGGDFVLAASAPGREYCTEYFAQKGFDTCYRLSDLQ